MNTSGYVYGADGTRLMKLEQIGTQPQSTTLYVGGVEIREPGVNEVVLAYPHENVRLKFANANSTPEVSYLFRDHLNSVRMIADENQAIEERSTYKPFGEENETILASSKAQETIGWIGERHDAGAGLQYLNARYYDPELGLFIQPDWFEVTKARVGTNRYSYSFNDPVNLSDPGGNFTEFTEAQIDAALAVAVSTARTGARAVAVAAGAAVLAAVAIVTPTQLADSSIGYTLSEDEVAAGWTYNPNTRNVVDKSGTAVKDAWGHHVRDRNFGRKVRAASGRKGQAHHVVEIGNKNDDAIAVRDILDGYQINPNDPRFGVALQNHKGRHKNKYARAVATRLVGLNTKQEIEEELEQIAAEQADIDDDISAAKEAGTHDGNDTATTWADEQLEE
ncbi:MAG: RHS repeat-associated core domain-containing protein [Pseudoruegeria sp.]